MSSVLLYLYIKTTSKIYNVTLIPRRINYKKSVLKCTRETLRDDRVIDHHYYSSYYYKFKINYEVTVYVIHTIKSINSVFILHSK